MENPNFESPFTWDIDEDLILNYDESELTEDEELPFLNFMNSLMATFIYTSKGNYNEARNNFRKMDELWSMIDQEQMQWEKVSMDTVNRILQATKYYTLLKVGDCIDNANVSWNNLREFELRNSSESNVSTLNGCKSIAWSTFHEHAVEKAITFARLASLGNPDCSLWHFLLGKNLRRSRRQQTFGSQPCDEEINSFLKAYELSRNPLYGIYAAQSYQENGDKEMSAVFYMDVFREKPTNVKIQLRLALGFLRKFDLPRAKVCLDYVEQLCPESGMLLHYKGIYYLKSKNYEEASLYLKEAARRGILGADLQYGQCRAKIDSSFDYILHLMFMTMKFKDNKVNLQTLFLHIAMEFYQVKNYEKSLKYLVKAIHVMPKSNTLKSFFHNISNRNCNIFDFVDNILLPEYQSNASHIPPSSQEYADKIRIIRTQLEALDSNTNQDITDEERNLNTKDQRGTGFLLYLAGMLIVFFVGVVLTV